MFALPCSLSMKWRVRPTGCNKLWFINNPLALHVSGTIMPIFRSAGHMLLHMIYRVHCTRPVPGFPRLQPAHPVLKPICSNIRPALLKMGLMMSETCCAIGLLINHNLLHLVGLTRHFIEINGVQSYETTYAAYILQQRGIVSQMVEEFPIGNCFVARRVINVASNSWRTQRKTTKMLRRTLKIKRNVCNRMMKRLRNDELHNP